MVGDSAGAMPEFRLEDGFNKIDPRKMWLDTKKLQMMLNRRSLENIRAHGGPERHNKLLKFCNKCRSDGYDETIVTVVAEASSEGNLSYQCLFECNGSKESFVLNGSFFRDFDLSFENKTNNTSTVMSATA